MKKITLILLILLVFGILGVSAMAMTSVPEIPQPTAYVAGVEGKASVMKKGSDEWEKIKDGQELSSGDSIKTESNGIVTVNLFDNSSSRIGPDSEITFDELAIDNENYGKTNVSISVQFGKVWSRIIQLMDKESSFEVGSDSTVATVRGTIFNFELSKDGIAKVDNIENLVEVAAVKIREDIDQQTGEKKKVKDVVKKINLTQGMTFQLDENINPEELDEIKVEKMSDRARKSEWFQDNVKADKEFEKELREKQKKLNKEMAGLLPDSPMYGIKKIGEKVRIAFAGKEEKQNLEAAFARQRLAEALELTKQGKTEKAENIFNEYKSRLQNSEGLQEKKELENQLIMQRMIMKDVLPEEKGFEFKEKIEDLQLDFNPESKDQEFLRAKIIEEKLDEARQIKQSGDIEAFNKYIEDIKREFEQENLMSPVLRERLELIQKAIENEALIKPNSESKFNPEDENNPESKFNPEDENNPTAEDFTEPTESIQEPQIVNEPIIQDVEPIREPAIIDEPKETLPPPPEPEIVPEAEPEPMPEIILEKKLDRLEVICDRYNMQTGQSTQCKAIAYYTDGSIRNVNSESSWSMSGDLGSVSADGLVTSDDDGGKGVVSATYSEDGLTRSANSGGITALNISLF